MTEQKQRVLDFIREQRIGVVATINQKGLPEAAAVAMSQTDDLEIVFQTPNTTRKYANLSKNPHVAIVLGCSQENYITVQYEGVAREVTDRAERVQLAKAHVTKNPGSAPYADLPDNKFFVVTPSQIKYSDLPNKVFFTL